MDYYDPFLVSLGTEVGGDRAVCFGKDGGGEGREDQADPGKGLGERHQRGDKVG